MKNRLEAVSFNYKNEYSNTILNAAFVITLLFGLLELALIQFSLSTTSQSISRMLFIGQISVLSVIASLMIHTVKSAIAQTPYSRIRGMKPGFIIVGLLFVINSVTSGLTSISSNGVAMMITATTSILFILAALTLFRKPKIGVKIGFGLSTLLLGIMMLVLYQQAALFNLPIAQFNAILMTYFYPLLTHE